MVRPGKTSTCIENNKGGIKIQKENVIQLNYHNSDFTMDWFARTLGISEQRDLVG